MKILVVGDFNSKIHSSAIFQAFAADGYDTERFATDEYFGKSVFDRSSGKKNSLASIVKKIQYHLGCGPIISKMNHDLLMAAKRFRPDLIYVYRGIHIFTGTVKRLGLLAVVFGFNNDDAFSRSYPKYFWRQFKKGILHYRHFFVNRLKNIADYKTAGCQSVSLLRSHYLKADNYFIDDLPKRDYESAVSFIGHFEDDGRDEALKVLLDNGIDLRIYGPEWEKSKHFDFFVSKMGPIKYLSQDYNLAINSAKICLVFLSRLNNDTYTRRCFEIPAAKAFMLSEYTEDLDGLFKEGLEAEYFRSKEELLRKVQYYLANSEERKKIAAAGYECLLRDGHEVSDRIKEIIRVYNQLKK